MSTNRTAAVALVAGAASGLVGPSVVRGLAGADEAERAVMMDGLHYTGLLNQAFAKIFVMFSGVAILLWSAAMLAGRELARALAVYGLVLGALLVLGILTGHLRLGIHGFGFVVLGESVWLA